MRVLNELGSAEKPHARQPAPPAPDAENFLGTALLVCTGPAPINDAALERLQALRACGIRLSVTACDGFKKCGGLAGLSDQCDISIADPEALLTPFENFCAQYNFVLLPCLSVGTAVKTVWGMTDTTPAKILFECLRRRFPVLFLRHPESGFFCVPWNGEANLAWPLWIRDNLHQIWRSFLEWGVREIELKNLCETAIDLIRNPPFEMACRITGQHRPPQGVRIFVTANDIEALWRAGEREVSLPPNALLTSEAHELAAKHKIKINSTFPSS